MPSSITIALLGDYRADVVAHQAIPQALDLAAEACHIPVRYTWVATDRLTSSTDDLRNYDGLWCVPASPYVSYQGALNGIRDCRERGRPFLGTCGGYQHALLDYAHHIGLTDAGNQEVDADCNTPLIAPLQCALIDTDDVIQLHANSRIAQLYGATQITETYRCSYGLNTDYLDQIDQPPLHITGFDARGEPRTFELDNHPFFIGTAYQPERAALANRPHPLINAFAVACQQFQSQHKMT